jgi:hypothetical protein
MERIFPFTDRETGKTGKNFTFSAEKRNTFHITLNDASSSFQLRIVERIVHFIALLYGRDQARPKDW